MARTTYYAEALAEGRKVGAANASDVQLMAMLCESTAQILLGAVAPALIFNGAVSAGLTSLELMSLMNTDPTTAADLMWMI